MTKKIRSVLLLVLALAGLWAFTVTDAFAANQVVSDCGDNGGANQLRAKLNAANSSGGGTITFTCGPTIALQAGMLSIFGTNVTLDGGSGITISGNNASRIFLVTYDATLTKTGTLTLNNVTLTKGYSGGEDGGAIWNGAGIVNLNNSKILDNQAGGSGGAIVSYGPLNITNSEFANNKGASGGALYLRIGSNPVTVKGSHFHDNQTTGTGGQGGAMLLESGAVVSIENSTLNNNQARSGLSANGGAISLPASSTLTMKNTTLNGNSASGVGGGIYNQRGTVNLTDVTLSGNSATYGGGINNYSGTGTLINSTVSGNSALVNGGGIFNDRGILHLTNVTLSGNDANDSGGGILTYASEMNLNNVTFHGNDALNGSAIFRTTGTANIKNTLIGNSTAGSNCYGITGGSFNLSDDGTCGFGAGRDNVPNLNLVPLANNGGSTKTHLPGAGSAAIDQAQCTDVYGNPVPKDQRGVSRPQGLACDVGAVEVQPAAPTPTQTKTATRTATRTATKPAPTATPTATKPAPTATRTQTKTATRTATKPAPTATRTQTRTATRTATKPAPTATRTPTTGCQTKPAKPTLKKPANDVTLSTTRPKLKWSAATCAATYKVVIKNAETGAKVHKKAGLIALKYKTDPLPTNVRLKWFVQACNGTFGCAKSAPRFFTTQ